MLVIHRKIDERVFIRTPDGREIVLTVIDARGGRIRLGLEAPKDVTIHREELLRRDGEAGDNGA